MRIFWIGALALFWTISPGSSRLAEANDLSDLMSRIVQSLKSPAEQRDIGQFDDDSYAVMEVLSTSYSDGSAHDSARHVSAMLDAFKKAQAEGRLPGYEGASSWIYGENGAELGGYLAFYLDAVKGVVPTRQISSAAPGGVGLVVVSLDFETTGIAPPSPYLASTLDRAKVYDADSDDLLGRIPGTLALPVGSARLRVNLGFFASYDVELSVQPDRVKITDYTTNEHHCIVFGPEHRSFDKQIRSELLRRNVDPREDTLALSPLHIGEVACAFGMGFGRANYFLLDARSEPAGAKVFWYDREIGETPLQLMIRTRGYGEEFALQKEGFADAIFALAPEKGEKISLFAELVARAP